jgi:hypothetical protein
MTSLPYPVVRCLLARGSSSPSRYTCESESKYHQNPMQPTATHGFYKSLIFWSLRHWNHSTKRKKTFSQRSSKNSNYNQNETKHWLADNHFVSED